MAEKAKQIIKHITGLNAAQILSNYTRVLTEFEETNYIAYSFDVPNYIGIMGQ